MAKIVSRGDPIEPVYLNNLRVAAHGWGVISGLAVSEKGAGADMSVDVAAGEAWINGTKITKGSTTNVAITAAHASYDRYDLLVINSSGTISVIDGTAAATSYANDYDLETNNAILLSEVYVPATDTTIEDVQITDKQIISFIEENNVANSTVRLNDSGVVPVPIIGILLGYLIGDAVLHSHDAEDGSGVTSYTLAKTITLDVLNPDPSTIRISFDMRTGNALYTVYGRIYKNGSPIGTERSTNSNTYVTFTEDIEFADGDALELYSKADSLAHVFVENFRVKGSETQLTIQEAFSKGTSGVADPFSATNS